MRLRTVLATVTAALAAATSLAAAGPANAQENHACSPSVSIDRFSDALDKTTYQGTFVGNFSALAGRATSNQTFEGLTLLPGGHTLLASMENAISGDSKDIVRFQTWERTKGGHFRLGAQYAYPIDSGLGVPEVQATPDGRLL